MEPGRGRSWSLTTEAFERLLVRLHADREKAGEEYEKVRRKLFSFFDWRGSPHPDTHADETLDRVARRLGEGEKVDHIHRYIYGVARRVLFESERQRMRESAALGALRATPGDAEDEERRLACLERCLQELSEEARALVQEYYRAPVGPGQDGRKGLAGRLGIPYGTLKTRVHRARVRLEACLHRCLGHDAAVTAGGSATHTGEESPGGVSGTSTSEREAKGYLLGTLPAEEQERIEEGYFAADAAYEDLLASADDLIHAYLVGALPETERHRFERHFLASPWRRQRVQFVQDLVAVLARTSTSPADVRPASPAPPPAPSTGKLSRSVWAAAAALLLASATAALLFRTVIRDAERASPGAVPAAPTPGSPAAAGTPASRSPAPDPRPSPRATAGRVHSVRVPRAASGVEIVLAPPARSVRLEVDVEGGHLSYDVVLTRGGRPVWTARELTRAGPDAPLAFSIPADLLPAGEYVVSVEGEPLRAGASGPPRVVLLRVRRP